MHRRFDQNQSLKSSGLMPIWTVINLGKRRSNLTKRDNQKGWKQGWGTTGLNRFIANIIKEMQWWFNNKQYQSSPIPMPTRPVAIKV